MAAIIFLVFCPRCDKRIERPSRLDAWDSVKEHVRTNHPDYDPEWWDTAPHSAETTVTEIANA